MQPSSDANPLSAETYPDAPLHGFQGDRGDNLSASGVPGGLTVALSREAGARGGTIGRRVARKLNWPIYDQELLEYMAQDGVVRQGLIDNLSAPALAWVEHHLERLLREQNLSQHPAIINLARVVLGLGANGEAVVIGRGAGSILPRQSTLHVRLVAPFAERVAYMSQWMRLTEAEAEEQVRNEDRRRAEFLGTHFHCEPNDVHLYDLTLNSSSLGEEICAELISTASQARSVAVSGGE